MMRPPVFRCFNAACVARKTPRTLMSSTRSISSSVVSSNVFGMAVPALFTRMSRPSKVATVFSTAALTAFASVASAWIAIAFPPAPSISLTTNAAASAPLVYVMATLAPSAARRLAIAAPMPREPPVMSAIFPSSFLFMILFSLMRFGDSLCIDRYKTKRWTKPCQMIYLLIGMKSETAAAQRGRPRAFDPDVALDRAMHVFWARGYEGAALSDLTRAMRINRPSLYAAFGNKEQLFRKVLDRYANGPLAYFRKALAAAKARDVTEQILLGAANMASDPRLPAGCLMVQGALACGDAAGSVRKEVAARRAASEVVLRRRLQRAKREGDLPPSADPAELARYVMTVLQGIAVQGADGASPDQLRRVAQIALRAWPKG